MPKDAAINIPASGYSYTLQKSIAEEVARGSFEEAMKSATPSTGVLVSQSQIQEITRSREAFEIARK